MCLRADCRGLKFQSRIFRATNEIGYRLVAAKKGHFADQPRALIVAGSVTG